MNPRIQKVPPAVVGATMVSAVSPGMVIVLSKIIGGAIVIPVVEKLPGTGI